MILAIGSVSESISVTAEAASGAVAELRSLPIQWIPPIWTALTLKGRDLFGYPPGAGCDRYRQPGRDQPRRHQWHEYQRRLHGPELHRDGVTDMDTGSNTSLQVEPNLDAVQELKVLTSNFQAEFGHNSGGKITVVTKNGTQEFHGTASVEPSPRRIQRRYLGEQSHPEERRRHTARTVPVNVETYSIGGPVFIPKHFNRDKKRLFFFWSQERTGQFVSRWFGIGLHADHA